MGNMNPDSLGPGGVVCICNFMKFLFNTHTLIHCLGKEKFWENATRSHEFSFSSQYTCFHIVQVTLLSIIIGSI